MRILRVKIASIVFMTAILSLILLVCIVSIREYEEQACILLEEKYSEQFEVVRCYGKDRFREFYEVLAVSESYPDILFEAKAACDGSYISDEYVSARVCRKIEEKLEWNLRTLPGDMLIKVQVISKTIDSANADMSVQEFVSIKEKDRFVVYLHYVPEDTERVYDALENAFDGLECLNGTMQLYITDEKTLKQIRGYFEKYAKTDNTYKKITDGIERVSIPFEHGLIDIQDDFGNSEN